MTKKMTDEQKAAKKATKKTVEAPKAVEQAPVVEAPKTVEAPKAEKKSTSTYTRKTLSEISRIYYAVINGEIVRNRRAVVGVVKGDLKGNDPTKVSAVITDKAERAVFDTYLAGVKTPDGEQVSEGMALINLSNDLRANGQIRPANAVTGKREAKTTATTGLIDVLEALLKGTPGVKAAQRVSAKRGQAVEVDYEGQVLQITVRTA